jgi:hypothetical protein
VLSGLNTINIENVLGPDFHPDRDRLFYVLDEAQVTGQTYMGYFSDAAGLTPRPVLWPIIRMMTEKSDTAVIVSGTGFSLDHFKTGVASGFAKDSVRAEWPVQHATGDFIEQDVQLHYISRYLPSSFLKSPSGMSLIGRAFKFLRGR